MQNIRLAIQYTGTRYLGWQRPEKDSYEKTVSYKIISVIQKITGEDIRLHAGAKTETGVHALSQTVNFHTASTLSPELFRTKLNQYLPQDIAVLDASSAPERFRADLNALSRTYEYRVCTAPVYDIFTSEYTAHLSSAPDINSMQKAAAVLIGKHDFSGFSGARKKKGTEKEILDIHFSLSDNEPDVLLITLTADDFLYQMPLKLISVLLEIGRKKRTLDSLETIFSGKEKPAVSCSSKGLTLKSIQY